MVKVHADPSGEYKFMIICDGCGKKLYGDNIAGLHIVCPHCWIMMKPDEE